jgi:hypothetical protein
MEDQIQSIINDLQVVASETSDPEKREELLRIIARLSNQDEWPNEDDLMRIRLRYSNIEN